MNDNPIYLVAEDNENCRILLNRAFLKSGIEFPIYYVEDGKEAIDYLKGNGKYANRSEFPFPAILLLDYDMPKLDGLGVLKALRSDPRLKSLIVVIFSSSVDDEQILRTYEAGANSYFEKPATLDDLVQSVTCINQYWFGCNHFPGGAGVVRPQKKHRPSAAVAAHVAADSGRQQSA